MDVEQAPQFQTVRSRAERPGMCLAKIQFSGVDLLLPGLEQARERMDGLALQVNRQ